MKQLHEPELTDAVELTAAQLNDIRLVTDLESDG